jgi:predicted signal transduction protein with EAL and GGDEF domain
VTSLLHVGCRVGQGFYFSRPLPAEEVGKLMAEGLVPRLPGGGGVGARARVEAA